jgi:hypothetical protein
MFCRNCGSDLGETAYCAHCGGPANPATASLSPAPPAPTKKPRAFWAALIIGMGLLVVIGMCNSAPKENSTSVSSGGQSNHEARTDTPATRQIYVAVLNSRTQGLATSTILESDSPTLVTMLVNPDDQGNIDCDTWNGILDRSGSRTTLEQLGIRKLAVGDGRTGHLILHCNVY